MPVRDKGFKIIFRDFPTELVEKLVEYHNINGGLSRYVKIRYFYEEILGKIITEEEVMSLANKFSDVMRDELINPTLLIKDSLDFIRANHTKYNMHVVSGSDQNELIFICEKLKLKDFFISIHGSPTPKNQLVSDLVQKYSYLHQETLLIGDSINDLEAAQNNLIHFRGYNNPALNSNGKYIHSFTEIQSRL